MPEQEVRKDINPQLCKKLNPEKHKWDHAWIVEPKFDGLRCIIVIEGTGKHRTAIAYSRNGRPLYNMEHITRELLKRKKNGGLIAGDWVLDGEVYTKDWNLSMGIVKSSVTKHPEADKIRYHVWDAITLTELKAGKSEVTNVNRKIRAWILCDSLKFTQ